MSSFENWKEEYGLQSEPNYSEHTEKDCKSAFEAGQQSQQAKIDELQARVDEVLIEMKNQLGDEDYYGMERPDYDAMLYALRNIKDTLKGNKDEN